MQLTSVQVVPGIVYPIIAVFDLPACLISILVFWKGNLELSKSTAYYIIAITAASFLLMLSVIVFRDIYYYNIDGLISWPNAFCGISNLIYFFAVYSVSWQTVAFTFDRFVMVCCGRLRMYYCTDRTSVIVIVCVYGGALLAAIPTLYMYQMQPSAVANNTLICVLRKDLDQVPLLGAYDSIQTVFWNILPIAIIVFLNFFTGRVVYLSNKTRNNLKGEGKEDPEAAKRIRSVILLGIISAGFLLHNIPKMVIKIVERSAYLKNFDRNDFTHPVAITRIIANMLLIFCSITDLCLFTLIMPKFREEIKRGIRYFVSFSTKH
ncbi:uncharacterized protein LOC127527066 [Erpetoichthys calabaricus]|uniref:uncharacterized protein LOC127527066 n=1 Tax=Erpetoichthys calabaricus TaxID=27687 RepID=UPI0022343F33|nr:uncharacterized protein LOC127527066 [Erpetoichthys calabaricus]